MKAHPGPAYNPAHYTRGYSRELVLDHVGECLSIYAELDEQYESEHGASGIPAELAVAVFSVIQTMVTAVEPVSGTPADARSKPVVVAAGGDPLERALRGA